MIEKYKYSGKTLEEALNNCYEELNTNSENIYFIEKEIEAKLFKSKVIYIETFANSKTKTLAGKIVYPIADTFIVQWESMKKLYPDSVVGGWIF